MGLMKGLIRIMDVKQSWSLMIEVLERERIWKTDFEVASRQEGLLLATDI